MLASKKIQSVFYISAMILLMVIATMNVYQFRAPEPLKYIFVLICGVYLFLLFKNRHH